MGEIESMGERLLPFVLESAGRKRESAELGGQEREERKPNSQSSKQRGQRPAPPHMGFSRAGEDPAPLSPR